MEVFPSYPRNTSLAFVKALGEPKNAESEAVERSGGRSIMALNRGVFSSDSADHYTPPDIIHRVVRTLGGIDLDPCSNSKRDPIIPAGEHYTILDNGLSFPWNGRIYLNPPYGRAIGEWIGKLISEYESGNVSEAIALVPARVDTAWFSALYDYPILFITGRLRFRTVFGEGVSSAPFPSAIVYLGNDLRTFAAEFGAIGRLYIPLVTDRDYRREVYG